MKSVTKSKTATDTHFTPKTKEDFLRWLRKKEALKKQTAEGKTLKSPASPRRQ